MNTIDIELILEKLGTTSEIIVPIVVEYLTHRANAMITVGIIFVAVGALLIGVGFIIKKTGDGFYLFIFGGFAFFIGVIFLGFGYYTNDLVTRYPEVSAYREIIGWLGRG